LATIDTPELDQQLDAAEARANAAMAQVKVATANESIAKITYERWWDSPKGVVSEQERQEKKSTYESATAQLEAAKAQHQLDEADVNRLKALEAFKQVTAPYDGVITSRHIDIGDLVTAGSSSGNTSLYTIAQADVIRTFIDVPQKAAAEMIVDLDATATSDQFPGRVFHGKVARSTRSIDPQSRTQRTEVDIPNTDLVLLPGMYVQVTFQLKQRGLLQVPAAAILFRPKGLQVAVVDDENKVEFHPITIAKDNGDTVELDSGVKENERVALNISNYIAEGEAVAPVDVDKELGGTNPPPPVPPPAPEAHADAPAPDVISPNGAAPVPDSSANPPAPAPAPPGAPSAVAPVDPRPASEPRTVSSPGGGP
jgi:RND family efflux transporter MFP subunit